MKIPGSDSLPGIFMQKAECKVQNVVNNLGLPPHFAL